MNKIENFVINIPGKNRFEKREKLAEWITSFVHDDPDCQGVRIEQVLIPEDSKFVFWTISAYSSWYVWIDVFMDGNLCRSRLEKIHKTHIEVLFSDDFDVEPLLPLVIAAGQKHGREILFPKAGQEIVR